MNLKVGIVGLPNAGKSTLFNALVTHYKAGVGTHPFTTIDKNIGVVEVPDPILFELAKVESIDKVTPATITFVDIAGLIKGAHKGEGLGNQFLHHIREVDLILHIIRLFHDEKIVHVHNELDPEVDKAVVEEELLLADLATLERQLKKEKNTQEERDLATKLIQQLDQGIQAREILLTDKEKEIVAHFNLMTIKPQIVIANIDEENIQEEYKVIEGEKALAVCAKFEAELINMPWTEQQQFLHTYGLKKSAKEQIIRACYQTLNCITFYTIAKRKEARAWIIQKGTNALLASSKVHTDFASHFVKVEAIGATELIHIGSWKNAHERGKVQIHGKEYQVVDQDVLEFKVNL